MLNKSGRIWTMVAGGGASVVYTDTICELGGAAELANYGEYSGAPTESQTADYAKTIFSLMCREKHPNGKVSGGGDIDKVRTPNKNVPNRLKIQILLI